MGIQQSHQSINHINHINIYILSTTHNNKSIHKRQTRQENYKITKGGIFFFLNTEKTFNEDSDRGDNKEENDRQAKEETDLPAVDPTLITMTTPVKLETGTFTTQ